jgi:hypothetical protein
MHNLQGKKALCVKFLSQSVFLWKAANHAARSKRHFLLWKAFLPKLIGNLISRRRGGRYEETIFTSAPILACRTLG